MDSSSIAGRTDRKALDKFFTDTREDTEQLRVTDSDRRCSATSRVITASRATTATTTITPTRCRWTRALRFLHGSTTIGMKELNPKKLRITFFGGEPLINLRFVRPRRNARTGRRSSAGFNSHRNHTNGLLLTARGGRFGCCRHGLKTTSRSPWTAIATRTTECGRFVAVRGHLTASSTTSGAFAGKVRIAVGGNFDADSVESYPALLDSSRPGVFRKSSSRSRQAHHQEREAAAKGSHPSPSSTLTEPLRRHLHDRWGSGGSSICRHVFVC